jgi:hypothetical protein
LRQESPDPFAALPQLVPGVFSLTEAAAGLTEAWASMPWLFLIRLSLFFVPNSLPNSPRLSFKNPHFMGISRAKPDHRHRRLLRTRRERPRRCRRAGQERYECGDAK